MFGQTDILCMVTLLCHPSLGCVGKASASGLRPLLPSRSPVGDLRSYFRTLATPWAYLSTVKRDTEKTCNQISETQELKQLEQPVLREPTLPKWWGTAGAPSIPRSVDRRPPWQVGSMSTQAQAGGGPGNARRRAVCQGSRAGSREKIKPHHRRCSCRRRADPENRPRPSPMVPRPQGHKEEKRKGQVRSWGGDSRSDPRSAADPQRIGRTE
jgi:hypothetical protein